MDFILTIERTHDLNLIKEAAFNEKIIVDLLEDGQTKDDCEFDVFSDCYLAVKLLSGELVGVYILKPISKTVVDIHPMILPRYRKGYCNKSLKCVFKWFLENCTDSVKKIVAQFPVTSKNIERFAIQNGFKKEGVNRLSFMKNGELVDQTMIGITRKEIEEVLL